MTNLSNAFLKYLPVNLFIRRESPVENMADPSREDGVLSPGWSHLGSPLPGTQLISYNN